MRNNPKAFVHWADTESMLLALCKLPNVAPHANTFEAAVPYHEDLKLDPIRWEGLDLVGYQEYDDNEYLELRNCPCGSTIAIIKTGLMPRRV